MARGRALGDSAVFDERLAFVLAGQAGGAGGSGEREPQSSRRGFFGVRGFAAAMTWEKKSKGPAEKGMDRQGKPVSGVCWKSSEQENEQPKARNGKASAVAGSRGQ